VNQPWKWYENPCVGLFAGIGITAWAMGAPLPLVGGLIGGPMIGAGACQLFLFLREIRED